MPGCDRTHRSEGAGQSDQALHVPHNLLMSPSLVRLCLIQRVGCIINQRKLRNEHQTSQNSERHMYAFGENGKEFIHDNAKPNVYIKKKKEFQNQ